MIKTKIIYDVAVIGGGPAGLMAAGRAAELGAKVILLEKNPDLGKKLLLTGGGRCNLTNYELEPRRFLAKFADRQKFLFSPFAQFGVQETLDFFHAQGLETKVEAEGRVFPVSDSAQSVLDVLIDYALSHQVKIKTGLLIGGFQLQGAKITGLTLVGSSEIIQARSYILATGGKSRPETGSTGEGLGWLRDLGHKPSDSVTALVPIKTAEPWAKRLSGVSLSDIKLTIYQRQKKLSSGFGKILFTHFGLSGPAVLNLSRQIGLALPQGSVKLQLDLRPDTEEVALDQELQIWLGQRLNKKLANCLNGFVPAALGPVLLELARVNPDKAVNLLTRSERLALIKLIKGLEVTVTGLMGVDKAIVTSGGLDLTEIDSRTMRSRLQSNLYLIGDILNIDRPSGGYSLQLCWTTGYVAGTAAVQALQ